MNELDFEIKEVPIYYGTEDMPKAELIKHCIQAETDAMGDNLWGLMNGFTLYSSHKMGSKKSFGSMLGSQAHFNNKAYKVVKELELSL